jgi:hypothetical protein
MVTVLSFLPHPLLFLTKRVRLRPFRGVCAMPDPMPSNRHREKGSRKCLLNNVKGMTQYITEAY